MEMTPSNLVRQVEGHLTGSPWMVLRTLRCTLELRLCKGPDLRAVQQNGVAQSFVELERGEWVERSKAGANRVEGKERASTSSGPFIGSAHCRRGHTA